MLSVALSLMLTSEDHRSHTRCAPGHRNAVLIAKLTEFPNGMLPAALVLAFAEFMATSRVQDPKHGSMSLRGMQSFPSSSLLTQQEKNASDITLVIAVGTQLANLSSDFDPRNFGFRKLSDLVRKTDAFEVEHEDGRSIRIREKPTKSPKQRS